MCTKHYSIGIPTIGVRVGVLSRIGAPYSKRPLRVCRATMLPHGSRHRHIRIIRHCAFDWLTKQQQGTRLINSVFNMVTKLSAIKLS
jgi:hypothetical protein